MDAGELEGALERVVDDGTVACPPRLRAAVHHAVFPGGARLRPRLVVAVARACGLRDDDDADSLFTAAAAVELLHCASLVHDDMPCFDDATERRGRPSVHAAFGQAAALLAGDALIVLAFDVLAQAHATRPRTAAAALRVLARAAGPSNGLVAGQAWELEPSVDLDAYHRGKTAALFEAATAIGALSAGADPAPFRRLGLELGLAYQIADDLADRVATPALVGKPTGRDATLGRPSAARGGVESARALLRTARERAIAAVPPCPGQASLEALVRAAVGRLVAG